MRELLQKALEVLSANPAYFDGTYEETLMCDIEAELAKPCEPMAYAVWNGDGKDYVMVKTKAQADILSGEFRNRKITPLYASPPLSQYEPLTYEEIKKAISHISLNEMFAFNIAKAVDAAVLKKIKGE